MKSSNYINEFQHSDAVVGGRHSGSQGSRTHSTTPCDGTFRIMTVEAGSFVRARGQAMGRGCRADRGYRRGGSLPVMVNSFSERPMDVHQAALFLGCKSGLVRKLVLEKRLPHYRLGRLLRFRRQDLEAYMASQSASPHDIFQTQRFRKGGVAGRTVAQKDQTTKREEEQKEAPPMKEEIEKLWR